MRLRKQQPEPVEYLNAGAALLEGARATGYALAYVDSVGVIERATFADVSRKAQQWRHALHKHSVQPGDRVVVLADRDREWRCALLGALKAGCVAVPCPASAPVAELRAVAEHVGGTAFASARARADLADVAGTRVLSANELDPRGAVNAELAPHQSQADDVALIICTRGANGFDSAVHTHAAVLAQAQVGESWLGLGRGERIWSTVAVGSAATIWLLLGAWRAGAEVIEVEDELDPHARLELLARIQPAAAWFSDDEYGALVAAAASSAFAVDSMHRVLTSGAPAGGATAFAHAFGANAAPVPEFDEPRAAPKDVADVEPAAPTVSVAPVPGEEAREDEDLRAAEQARREDEARAQEEAESRRGEDEKRREKERRREEEQQAKARRKEEERRRADEARARAEEERRRADDEKRREKERRREAERAQREEEQRAKARQKEEERGGADEEPRHAEGGNQRAEEPRREAPEKSDDERLAPSILSQISAYGAAARAGEPGERSDAQG